MSRFYWFCIATLLLAGCPKGKPTENARPGNLPPQGEEIRLVVVDDPDMASAIELLRGEWQAQTNSKLAVEQTQSRAWLDGEPLEADAIVFPSGLLGSVAEKGRLWPIPTDFNPNIKHLPTEQTAVFGLLRSQETLWGTETLAVPFGSAVWTCYCRADLLEKLERKPPSTWAEYQDLAQQLAEREPSPETTAAEDASTWHGTLEPLAPGWASQILLARAAAYATYREHHSVLFHIATMDPFIAGEPFVRALEELMASAPSEAIDFDPSAVRRAFWQGQCGMAICWPTAAVEQNFPGESPFPVVFSELPGSPDVYDYAAKTWKKRLKDEQNRVTLLATAGRLGSVLKSSEWPEASKQLLLWLSGKQWSGPVCSASQATTLFRTSHFSEPKAWVEPLVNLKQSTQYAEITQTALTRPQRLFSIRIPGRSEYLDALDTAVHQSLRGEASPQEALDRAATQWQQITDRLGRDIQKAAYLRSLGVD